MNREIKIIAKGSLVVIVTLLLAACASHPQPVGSNGTGTAWGTGAFRSNGERIYFTATSERGTAITYTGDQATSGGMMMGGGRLACASCHGPDGRGGVHNMGAQNMGAQNMGGQNMGGQNQGAQNMGGQNMGGQNAQNMGVMQTMTAKDIRWSALKDEFDAEKFRLAVTKGQDPDGTQLNANMPRWNIGNDDLADLITYLKTLP